MVDHLQNEAMKDQLPNDDSDRGHPLQHEGPTAPKCWQPDELTRKGKPCPREKSTPEDQLLIEMITSKRWLPDIIKPSGFVGRFHMRKNRALVRLRQHAKSAGLMS